MSDFSEFWDSLRSQIVALTKDGWGEFADAAQEDAQAFLEEIKTDLQRWFELLRQGQLTREEFQWLLESKKELFQLKGLKQAGVGLTHLQRFQNTVIFTLIDVATEMLA